MILKLFRDFASLPGSIRLEEDVVRCRGGLSKKFGSRFMSAPISAHYPGFR